jgi:hypothetical protein
MKKIRLDIEELEVRSFETEAAPEPHGTVRGREYSLGDQSCYQACFQQTHEFETCYETGITCGASCDWGCDSRAVCQSDTGHCGPSYPPHC